MAGRNSRHSNADSFQPDVADTSIGSIAPSPAAAEIEKTHLVADLQNGDVLGIVVRFGKKWRWCDDVPRKGIRIMRGYHFARESGIGQVFAIGVRRGVGKVRGTRQSKPLNGMRRRVPCCAR